MAAGIGVLAGFIFGVFRTSAGCGFDLHSLCLRLHLKFLQQLHNVRSVRGQDRLLGSGYSCRGWVWNSLRAGLGCSADLFEPGLPSRLVSCHVDHAIIALGFCEYVLEPLLSRLRGLDVVSAKLGSAEF